MYTSIDMIIKIFIIYVNNYSSMCKDVLKVEVKLLKAGIYYLNIKSVVHRKLNI